MSLKIYNTLSRKKEDFTPVTRGQVGIYSCGVTVYDLSHAGHARSALAFDVMVRYLRFKGLQVRFVRNFTDVDDKIIRRAAKEGVSASEISERYVEAFRADMRGLGVIQADVEPKATEHVPQMVELIGKLIAKGVAYPVDGDVYFEVRRFAGYGKLSGKNLDELLVGARVDVDERKRDPRDFALWKAAKPGEPAWDSPWGPGRPGWHVECSAMAWETLGETIDIHGGGLDLVFPHHENEIAQSECAHGATYARYWMHNGLLTVADGRKMGKSLGNSLWIRDLLHEYPAEALRLYYLQCHYRSPLPFDEETLSEALGMLARLYEAREVAERMSGGEDADSTAKALGADALEVLALGRAFPDQLASTLADDFNTAAALGHLFELARAVNRLSNQPKAIKRGGPVVAPALAAFATVPAALGLLALSTAEFQADINKKRLPALGLTAAEIDALVAERTAARMAKNYARADAIRDDLEGKSIAVMDRGEKSEWRVRL